MCMRGCRPPSEDAGVVRKRVGDGCNCMHDDVNAESEKMWHHEQSPGEGIPVVALFHRGDTETWDATGAISSSYHRTNIQPVTSSVQVPQSQVFPAARNR